MGSKRCSERLYLPMNHRRWSIFLVRLRYSIDWLGPENPLFRVSEPLTLTSDSEVVFEQYSHGRIMILSLFMNIHFIWGYEVTDLWYLPLHESIFRRSRNLKLFPTFDILFVKMEPQTTPESGRFSKKTIWCDMDSRCARLTNIWTETNKPGNYLNPVALSEFWISFC